MKTVIKFARKSRHPYFKHATLILKGSRVMAWGVNHDHIHSERDAACQIRNLQRCLIINVRVTKTGRIANSKPCPECETYLKSRGAKKVIYSTPKGFIEEIYG